jgi:CheY-like chemotaxis protein
MTVEGLVKALHGAGFDTHPDHLLDALWLGSLGRDLTTIAIPTTDTKVRPALNEKEDDHETPGEYGRHDRKDADGGEDEQEDVQAPKRTDGETSSVYGAGDVAAEDVTIPAAGIILPSARTLPDRLPLIRAMRPFRRQFPSHVIELDEARTAELTAEMRAGVDGSVFPVLRPSYERWYEAHVVVEDDPTIELWTAPVREFTQLLRDAGAFRLIRSWRLRLDSSTPLDPSKARLESPAGGLSSTRSLGGARQLIFFASHGLSPRWADGTYARLLVSWSTSSVVLLHLQPRSRWSQTMLGEPQALAHSLQPGSPNATLHIETFWWRPGPDPDNTQVVRLPAIVIEPASLEVWARTLMGLGRQTEAFLLDPAATWPDYSGDTPPSKEEDVQRALATLQERSAAAYDLAIMLASAPFTLPVARLVQEVTQNGNTDFTVLAELMLSGIVAPRAASDTVARETTYFMIREQARPLLLRSLRGVDADALARSLDERISKHLTDIAGRTMQFSALIAHPEGQAKLPIWAQEFAHITNALHNRPGPTLPGRTWKDVLDGLDWANIGRMARLASARIALSSEVVDERLWRYVDDPRIVQLAEDKELRFAPLVAEFLQKQLASMPYLGLTILWVDDNPDNNADIASRLTDAGAAVFKALDTKEALADSRLPQCDLVISDMSRHGNDVAGYELIRSLQASNPSVPVLIFAGYSMASNARRSAVIEAGAFGGTNREAELFSLIERAAVASVLRKGSSARTAIESEVSDKLSREKRDIKNIRDGSFCTLDELYQSLGDSGYLSPPDRIVDSLMFFESPLQRSWLIATNKLLLFVLDDRQTRRQKQLCQRTSPLSDGSNVKASIDSKGVATVRIGGGSEPAWYYSPALFQSPRDLETAVRQLVHDADPTSPQLSSERTDFEFTTATIQTGSRWSCFTRANAEPFSGGPTRFNDPVAGRSPRWRSLYLAGSFEGCLEEFVSTVARVPAQPRGTIEESSFAGHDWIEIEIVRPLIVADLRAPSAPISVDSEQSERTGQIAEACFADPGNLDGIILSPRVSPHNTLVLFDVRASDAVHIVNRERLLSNRTALATALAAQGLELVRRPSVHERRISQYALVVGNDRHLDREIPQLRKVIESIEIVSILFEDLGFSVELLFNRPAATIRKSLDLIAGLEAESVVLYFAGSIQRTSETVFLASDSIVQRMHSAISLQEIANAIARSSTTQTLVIFDTITESRALSDFFADDTGSQMSSAFGAMSPRQRRSVSLLMDDRKSDVGRVNSAFAVNLDGLLREKVLGSGESMSARKIHQELRIRSRIHASGSELSQPLLFLSESSHEFVFHPPAASSGVLTDQPSDSAFLSWEQREARRALLSIVIDCRDAVVLDIIFEAAKFRPAQGYDPQISMTRLLCGAMMVGDKLPPTATGNDKLRALSAVLNSATWQPVQQQLLGSFGREDALEASKRLSDGFSSNARKALTEAAGKPGSGDDGLSSDSLVRTLLTPSPDFQSSLLYRIIPNVVSLKNSVESFQEHGGPAPAESAASANIFSPSLEYVSDIQSLDLPATPKRGAADQGPPPAFTAAHQAVTVGSQMAEFSSAVPQAVRPVISNGLLLGQLAADKATAGNADPAAYFGAFNSVMKRIGWEVTSNELTQQTISDQNAELHKAIIPIVTAIFGPAAAGSIIIAVLKGLRSLDQDAPWITVFEQKSTKVKAANFGLSYVDGGTGGGATVKTAYFTLQASDNLTQVLFFKFQSSDATMKIGQCQMSLSPQTIATSASALEAKVGPFIADNIKNIAI